VHRPTNRGLLILGGRDLGRDSRVKPVLPVDVADQVDGPPLKWAGGKRWQVPHLRPFWDLPFNSRGEFNVPFGRFEPEFMLSTSSVLRPIQRAPGTLDGAARRRPPGHGQRDVY
jgi:hypothetical protein